MVAEIANLLAVAGSAIVSTAVGEALNRLRAALRSDETTRSDVLQVQIDELRARLQTAGQSLGGVTDILQRVQKEIDTREQTLADLDERVKRGEDLAKVGEEATAALNAVLQENFERTEKRIGRLAWWQGGLYALVGAAVALLINAYAEPLAHLFK